MRHDRTVRHDALTIRPGGADDLHFCRCLCGATHAAHHALLPSRFGPGTPDSMLAVFGKAVQKTTLWDRWRGRRNTLVLRVADWNGTRAGYVLMNARWPEDGDPLPVAAAIADIAVDERFRRRGIGRALLADATAFAADRAAPAASQLCAQVWTGNDASRALFAAAGFAQHNVEPGRLSSPPD